MLVKTLLALNALTAATASAAQHCKSKTLDFVYLEGDATVAAIVDDIHSDLLVVGVNASRRPLAKSDLNKAMQSGDFDMVLGESWGNPYDPHSYLTSWTVANEAHHNLLDDLKSESGTTFAQQISDILSEPDASSRQDAYTTLLKKIHNSYLHIPLYGKRIPS